ncbi:spermatogenesis-associated protein 4 isoform 2-T2 [Odontesthes bonariensis]|uniref:spermatogenesis-associated protein 4 n=1 Tax=Odontesthes bonariensis TaxID=219752 RepID=UPI003F588C67
MYRAQCPKKTGLPREVVKWLQSLDLSFYPKNVRRDISNGYLVAEIFSHRYRRDFPLHSYDKGASLSAKQRNWSQIQQSMQKHNLYLTKEAIDGTIHCKPGAAELLVQELYAILTNRSASAVQRCESDFTDQEYQELLPSLARSTASQAIKNNLTVTEIMAEPDINTNQRKAQIILNRHREHKAAEKVFNPGRFQLKSNRSQLEAKYSKPPNQGYEYMSGPSSGGTTSKLCALSPWSGAYISFKDKGESVCQMTAG